MHKFSNAFQYELKWDKKFNMLRNPLDTGRKLHVHKTFRRRLGRLGRLLNVLCTFNLRPVSTGTWWILMAGKLKNKSDPRKKRTLMSLFVRSLKLQSLTKYYGNFKGTLMQISKSVNILVLYENNMLKISH